MYLNINKVFSKYGCVSIICIGFISILPICVNFICNVAVEPKFPDSIILTPVLLFVTMLFEISVNVYTPLLFVNVCVCFNLIKLSVVVI